MQKERYQNFGTISSWSDTLIVILHILFEDVTKLTIPFLLLAINFSTYNYLWMTLITASSCVWRFSNWSIRSFSSSSMAKRCVNLNPSFWFWNLSVLTSNSSKFETLPNCKGSNRTLTLAEPSCLELPLPCVPLLPFLKKEKPFVDGKGCS